jgi:hypothetical protein
MNEKILKKLLVVGGGAFSIFRRFGFFAFSFFRFNRRLLLTVLSVRCKRISLPYTTSLAMVFSFVAATFREVGVIVEELK